jgi:hypothetical protein
VAQTSALGFKGRYQHCLAHSREAHQKNELDRVVIVRTSKLAARELQRLCGEIWRKDKSFVSPVPKGSLGEQRTLEIQADSLRMLRDTLKAAR